MDKVTRQCPQTTTFLKRKRRAEAVSNRSPSAYQPNALPLGQTGSLYGEEYRLLLLNLRLWPTGLCIAVTRFLDPHHNIICLFQGRDKENCESSISCDNISQSFEPLQFKHGKHLFSESYVNCLCPCQEAGGCPLSTPLSDRVLRG